VNHMSPARLAADPTATTVSRALTDAAQHAAEGPILAISRAVYGSTDPDTYAMVASPSQTLAWGVALIAVHRMLDRRVPWPDGDWGASRCSEAVGAAHQAVTAWAADRRPGELAALFRLAADEVRHLEVAR
jgi:hypothetical protein